MSAPPFFTFPLAALERSIATVRLALRTLPSDQLRDEAELLDGDAGNQAAATSIMRRLYREELARRVSFSTNREVRA